MTALLMLGCVSTKTISYSDDVVSKSCTLNELLNDTLIIDGVYSTCMEYSSFQTIKKDDCFEDYKMELNLSEEHIKKSILKNVYDMNACNATRRMIVKGFVRKEKEGYGHLGTNNAEITVIEFIRLDDIEYEKVKN
tara:strand:+ start:42 stop:449 length:408 start_codon:yes stop_codon:yes gene_type:complete